MKYTHLESIQVLEEFTFSFANGLDQRIHGTNYEKEFEEYQKVMDDLLFLYHHREAFIDLIQKDEQNIKYF